MKRLLAFVGTVAGLCAGSLLAAKFSSAGVMLPMAQEAKQPAKDANRKVGLLSNEPGAFQGYTLISPLLSTTTYLLDMQGRIVRTWEGAASPQTCAYLLPNGNLLRPCGKSKLSAPGTGGRIQEFAWDGQLVWDYAFPTDRYLPHHDITKMPNGNILALFFERKTAEQCAAGGRKDGAALEVDGIVEIRPMGKDGGEIVWQWHLWDHLIQDHDDAKAKFGAVAEHPELVDINLGGDLPVVLGMVKVQKAVKAGGIPGGNWTHTNAVAYHPELDQIMVSVHGLSEIWIIDHATTTAEAAGHTGGKRGKGGDLLYRWGNPQNYRAGKPANRVLFHQHNAHWIPSGLPGAGNVLLFNNGMARPDGAFSSVEEINLPVDAAGAYPRKPGAPFGPEKAGWTYTAPTKTDFYSQVISGAQRLANGNTLACAGTTGTVIEVTPRGEVVWKYANPIPGGFGGIGTWLFRAYRYGVDDPAFAGRTLTPGKTIEDTLADNKGKSMP
jgi:Arylsulfotransferase (ASST)